MEYCAEADSEFDAMRFDGLYTPVLTFISGELAAWSERYDMWLNVIFKQTFRQEHRQCTKKAMEANTLFPPKYDEELKRKLAEIQPNNGANDCDHTRCFSEETITTSIAHTNM